MTYKQYQDLMVTLQMIALKQEQILMEYRMLREDVKNVHHEQQSSTAAITGWTEELVRLNKANG